MKRIFIPLVAALAFVAIPRAAHAQDEWVRQVRSLLGEAGKRFEQEGYELTHQIYTGSLNSGRADDVQVELEIGKEYQLMGACDTDCSDLDFTLFDAAGNQVDQDVLEDDFPIVSVTPRRSGRYRVHVTMVTCSSEPCRYGIGIFGK